jgi:heat shock protein HslJ
MKKLTALIAGATLGAILLTGCHSDEKVKPDALLYHRFALVKANGDEVKVEQDQEVPYIEFNENFNISGKMCNNFSGQAIYKDGKITSDNLVSTKMLCPSDQLNKLDYMIDEMLKRGANVALRNNQLTLKSGNDILIFNLRDVVN